MSSELVTIIPPGTGGVRDYAELMAQHIHTRILAPTPATPLSDYGNGDLFVHFSGYGFQQRGLPTWLVKRLRQAKSGHRRVGIFFHELFASGPPWRSAFWLNVPQRTIAADLVRLADFWMTNRESAAQWLIGHRADAPHACLPVYSNIGEPESITTGRSRKVVLFGGSGSRTLAYKHLDEHFWHWLKSENFEFHDIGPALESRLFAELKAAHPIHWHGELPAHEVSALLADAAYGVISYPTSGVAKSGVFAAYCVHGVCPVILARTFPVFDGLRAGVHYAPGISALLAQPDAERIGAEARRWYMPHDVQAHVRALGSLLQTEREATVVSSCS